MGRREVIEISCDRCGRTETQNKSEVRQGEEPEFQAKLGDVVVSFPDLCRRCRETVHNYFDRVRLAKEDAKGNGHVEPLTDEEKAFRPTGSNMLRPK